MDGSTVPIPALPNAVLPIKPTINSPFEFLSFQIDPKRKVGSSDSFDFTIQRELSHNLLLEVGYMGRRSRNLYQGLELNQVPFFMKDKVSGQTFAQAFDAVARVVRSGTPVTPQPWFENALKGSSFCAPSCTAGVASAFNAEFTDGFVFDLITGIQDDFVFGPVVNEQILSNYMISSLGRSNFNAGFLSLQKRLTHGFNFGLNYTLFHSLDQIGYNQSILNALGSSAYPQRLLVLRATLWPR